MPYALGIDVGTTFTAAAVFRLGTGGSLGEGVPLTLGTQSQTIPTVVVLGEDGEISVGDAAERKSINSPDRVIREFKRRIGDTVPIVVGDIAVTAEDLYATIVRWVVDRAEEREGTHPDAITVSHPAGWGGYKTALVREALAGVGLADVALVTEPHAAAVHYAAQQRVANGSTIAVYDLGGGTFDTAILRKMEAGVFTMLGYPEGLERLGGVDFDDAVFRHVTAELAEPISKLDLTDPDALYALARLRRDCIDAKESLSYDGDVSIPVQLPGYHSRIRLVRSEFEDLIGELVRETVAAMRHTLKTAKLDAEDLTSIVLIGGSSRIPLITEMLSQELRRPIAVDADPKASISLGAAAVASALLRAADTAPIAPVDVEAASAAEAASALDAAPRDAGSVTRSSFGRPKIATPPKPAAAPVPIMSRASVRILALAAAGATVFVLAGTASGISPNSTLAAQASSSADYTRWQGPAGTPTSIFAAPPASPAPEATAGEETGGDDSSSPTPFALPRPGTTPQDKGGSTPKSDNAPAGPAASTPTSPSAAPATGSTPAAANTAPADQTPAQPVVVPPATTPPTEEPAPVPDPVPVPDPTPEPQPEPEPEPEPAPTTPPSEEPLSTAPVTPEPDPTAPSEEPTNLAV